MMYVNYTRTVLTGMQTCAAGPGLSRLEPRANCWQKRMGSLRLDGPIICCLSYLAAPTGQCRPVPTTSGLIHWPAPRTQTAQAARRLLNVPAQPRVLQLRFQFDSRSSCATASMKQDHERSAADSTAQHGSLAHFYKSMQWKREHRPDRDRFVRPYKHTMRLPDGTTATVSLTQCKFTRGITGFASTVWDSSIVVAKHVEKWPERYAGKRCLDLSANCGLVGIVLAAIGAQVTATDLAHNLPLLQDNCKANVPGQVAVLEHVWGEDVCALLPPFDYIFACDVMYVVEAIPALVASLCALAAPASTVLVAHGRNRFAERAFIQACAGVFTMEQMAGDEELDAVYQCSDVDVLRLRRVT